MHFYFSICSWLMQQTDYPTDIHPLSALDYTKEILSKVTPEFS